MQAPDIVTWRAALPLQRGLGVLRETRVTRAEHEAALETDDQAPHAALAGLLVERAALDVVYGVPDPDGYDAAGAMAYVEVVSAPDPAWVGFARVNVGWSAIPPYRGRQPSARILRMEAAGLRPFTPLALGVHAYPGIPPADPARLAALEANLRRLEEADAALDVPATFEGAGAADAK